MKPTQTIKNRGALSNPDGRFEPQTREHFADGWDIEEDILPPLETFLFPEHSKSVISHNDSLRIRMRGEGEYANLLKTRFHLACKKNIS